MSLFNPLDFQRDAVESLVEVFVELWKKDKKNLPIVFKSPTGSGKTFMVANFIKKLNHLPQWQEDKAFVWITFSDDLAMQSRDKFKDYFENQLENGLLTVDDINRGKLYENDIVFLNWQKIVSKSAESRVLRRPEEEEMQKEFGKYWEDFIDGTKKDKREIILIIDEAHKNKSTKLAQEVIDYINPRVILHVTATPEERDELEAYRLNSLIEVDRERVVEEGLIKEKILVQTDEDLKKYKNKDLDEVLLDLGIEKRTQLIDQYKKIKKDINPLMLIQLPNDDKKLVDAGGETKENVVCSYFKKKGILDKKIAKWFDGRQENMELITDNNSEIDFMLFKQTAGTGWDCPRASVLVMFREIKSNKFYTQTVGRILRMPEPELKEDYTNNEVLKTGYLFTNYKRNQVQIPDQNNKNKARNQFAKIKNGVKNIELKSSYISRVDYGDIPKSHKFQVSFNKSLDEYFGIEKEDILGRARTKLKKKGVELDDKLTNKIIVNAKFTDFDHLNYDFSKEGDDLEIEMSVNDVEKTFNYICYQLLLEQTDETAKFSNVSRSWSRLKSAIRVWLKKVLGEDSDYFYRIFVKDINKSAESKFRPAITKALKEFKPIARDLVNKKKERKEDLQAPTFTIQDEYSYSDEYVEENQNLCVLDKFYILPEYRGKKNELNFKNYIDRKNDDIEWWFKNGDYGQSYYAIKYFNSNDKKEALFYPDWIIKFKDGRIGIFDTKQGITAEKTTGKAKALSKKIKQLGKGFVGGIAIFENGTWLYNDSEDYKFIQGQNGQDANWKNFEDLFNK
jgi:type III restriction enzyme